MEDRRNHVRGQRLTELVPQHVGIEWPLGGVEGHQVLTAVGPGGDHDCTLADAGQPQECVLNLADLYPEATDLDLSIAAIAPALPRLGRAPPAHLRDRRPRVSGVRRSPAVPPPRSKIRPWSRGFCATLDCRPRCRTRPGAPAAPRTRALVRLPVLSGCRRRFRAARPQCALTHRLPCRTNAPPGQVTGEPVHPPRLQRMPGEREASRYTG